MQEIGFIILLHLMFLDKLAYDGAFEQWDFGNIHIEQREKNEFTKRVDTLISSLLAIKLPITFDLRNRQILKVHYNFGTQSYPSEFTFCKGLKPSIVLSISCSDTMQEYNGTDRNIVTNDWCRHRSGKSLCWCRQYSDDVGRYSDNILSA